MLFKVIIAFLAAAASVNALVIPNKRTPLTFGPFTPEQWSEYTQLISNAEASGAIQSKRAPLTFGPFTPEQWSEYSQLISNAEASGAIQSKREPLTFGPFTPEQWSEYSQLISNAEASGAIQSKRDQKLGNSGTGRIMMGDYPTAIEREIIGVHQIQTRTRSVGYSDFWVVVEGG